MPNPIQRPQLLSSGFELAAAVLGFALVGRWLGGKFDSALLGTAIGGILGIVGGMYNLIRQALVDFRQAATHRKKSEK
jgi:Putative F0F1-ATPase subunit Ca2+/Mg2+ transporter